MAFLYQSDGVVAEGYANFQKLVRIAISIITIDTILHIFAYPCATRYADFIGFSGEPHLNLIHIRFGTMPRAHKGYYVIFVVHAQHGFISYSKLNFVYQSI